jgi:hypothetical protein
MCILAPLSRAQVAPQSLAFDASNPPQSSRQNAPDTTKVSSESAKQGQADTQKKQEKRKLLGIVPDYTTVEPGEQSSVLPPGKKFKLGLQYFSVYTVVFVALESAANQASNSPAEYGQGAQGYGKRYGANFADGVTNGVFVTGVFPSLLHQDPRYYRMATGGTFHRGEYAASRVLLTRQDSGRASLNFSEVFGNFTSGAISTAYYPDSERNASSVFKHAGIQLGFDAGFNVLKEFAPDLERRFLKRKQTD